MKVLLSQIENGYALKKEIKNLKYTKKASYKALDEVGVLIDSFFQF